MFAVQTCILQHRAQKGNLSRTYAAREELLNSIADRAGVLSANGIQFANLSFA